MRAHSGGVWIEWVKKGGKKMTEWDLEELQKKARMQEERAQAEYEIARKDPYAARMRAAHENAMERHHSFVQSSPNSHAPSERKAAEEYFAKKWEDEQRRKQFEEAQRERDTRKEIAEYEMIGKRDYGLSGERERAEATKYASDNTLKGGELKARSDVEIARNKAEADEIKREKERILKQNINEKEWNTRQKIEETKANVQNEKSIRETNAKKTIAKERNENMERINDKKIQIKQLEIMAEKGIIEDGKEIYKNGKKLRYDAKQKKWIEVKD